MGVSDVARRFGSSVVLIEAEFPGGLTHTGSGFLVSPGGAVATSLHLVDGARSLTVRIEGERFEAGHVRAFDIEQDLAVIQIGAPGFNTLGLTALEPGDSRTLQRGDPIYVISNPLGLVGTVSEGILSAWREPRSGEKNDLDLTDPLRTLPKGRLLQISAPVSPGSSGAPVFDAFGDVVGVIAGGMESGALALNFAVAIEELLPLLETDQGWDLASLRRPPTASGAGSRSPTSRRLDTSRRTTTSCRRSLSSSEHWASFLTTRKPCCSRANC